jgi:hypothetical protein
MPYRAAPSCTMTFMESEFNSEAQILTTPNEQPRLTPNCSAALRAFVAAWRG